MAGLKLSAGYSSLPAHSMLVPLACHIMLQSWIGGTCLRISPSQSSGTIPATIDLPLLTV